MDCTSGLTGDYNIPHLGSLMRLIVGDHDVRPTPFVPRLLRARISRPMTLPTPRMHVRFHVHPRLRASGNVVALPHVTPWIALVPLCVAGKTYT